MGRHPEPCADLLGAETPPLGLIAERVKLVGWVHVVAGGVLVQADFHRVVFRIQSAADRLGLLDLLALDAQQLAEPAPLAGGDEIVASRLAVSHLRLHHKVLDDALNVDASRERLDGGLGVRHLAHIVRGFLELVEGHENLSAALDSGFGVGSHNQSPYGLGLERSAALQPCPSARPG